MIQNNNNNDANRDKTGDKSVKKPRPLTRKQAAFVRELVENPKQSATKAAAKTYSVSNLNVARSMAAENLAKPAVMLELAKHSKTAEQALTEVLSLSSQRMTEDKPRAVDWAVNTRQTADSILDRIHGKAKQSVDVTSTAVTLNIDLSSE
jgi:hypothetical protein